MSEKETNDIMGSAEKAEEGPQYPFARARVERIINQHCPNAEVSPRVRLAFNKWLGKMVEGVAKELAKVPHKTITEEDFRNVVSKYSQYRCKNCE